MAQLEHDTDEVEASRAPLLDHLIELRSRLVVILAFLSVGFIVCFIFSGQIYQWLLLPYRDAAASVRGVPVEELDLTANFFAPLEFFFVRLKLSLVGAIIIGFPVIAWQIYGFVAPGLYRHEKKLAVPLLASSVLLFYGGAAFAYFVVFPLMFQFFTTIAPEGVAVTTDISSYLDFVLALFLAFGVAFELPIAIVLMVATGITTVEKLAASRAYVVVACFVIGMMLTPPDIISQTLLAVPMWLLFEIGLIFGRLVRRQQLEREEDNAESR